MAFTASDICKVSFSLTSSHPTSLTSNHTDLVRPLEPELVLDKRVSFFVSFAIFIPPVGVALEKGCGVDFCINILLVRRPHLFPFATRLTLIYQTILGYMCVGSPVSFSSSPAHSTSLVQPRNHSRYVVHTQLSDCN